MLLIESTQFHLLNTELAIVLRLQRPTCVLCIVHCFYLTIYCSEIWGHSSRDKLTMYCIGPEEWLD